MLLVRKYEPLVASHVTQSRWQTFPHCGPIELVGPVQLLMFVG